MPRPRTVSRRSAREADRGHSSFPLIRDFAVNAEAVDAGTARRAQLLGRELFELVEIFHERRLDRIRGRLRIAMRAADGFGQHFVDELELAEAIGREVHRL